MSVNSIQNAKYRSIVHTDRKNIARATGATNTAGPLRGHRIPIVTYLKQERDLRKVTTHGVAAGTFVHTMPDAGRASQDNAYQFFSAAERLKIGDLNARTYI